MTDEERLLFIEQIATYVRKYAPVYGICVHSPIIAQACLESAYGTSHKAQYHNYFGLKYRGDRLNCHNGYFSDTSSEQNEDGTYTDITTDWYSFEDMEHGVEGYFQFTNISNYDNLKAVTDPRTYLENIKADGYATSLDYVDNVMNVIEKWNLTQYDDPIEQRGIKIAIDAGHGSNTAGKRHPDGYREHWSDTYMAFYLNQILVKNGFETLKTSWDDDNPTDDEDVALSTRQAQILAFGADISVSIHANAHGNGTEYTSASGISTHYHSNTEKVGDSVTLATALQNQLIKNTTQNNRGIVAQDLAMCNCVAMGTKASVLVESAFMTNAEESALLKTDEFCIEVAREIAQGIFDYFGITDADANVAVVLADRSFTDGEELDINNATVTLDNPVVDFYGGVQCPIPTVVYNGTSLNLNVHYSLEYSNNINAGTGYVILTGIGTYTGTKTVEFIINPRSFEEYAEWVYTEDSDRCINIDELEVTCIGFILVKDKDYTLEVTYSNYENYKLAICNAYGIGNYTGVLNGGFFVEKLPEEPEPIDINTIEFILSSTSVNYTGEVQKPSLTNNSNLVENTDYEITYEGEFINAGNYNVIITGIGNYTGTKTLSFAISPIVITNSLVSCGEADENGCYNIDNLIVVYDNKNLVLNTDYTANIQQGENENYKFNNVTITGINNYTGSVNKTFNYEKIEQEEPPVEPELIDIKYLTIGVEPSSIPYTGKEINPTITITDDDENELIKDTDFTVEITNNINVGFGECLITGIGQYTGNTTISFEITRLSISSADITCGEADENGCYNIDNLSIKINDLTLTENDYDIEVEIIEDMDYINSNLIITGKGNFKDSREVTYRTGIIEKTDISSLKFTLNQSVFDYNGNSHTPELKVEDSDKVLVENEDYSIIYLNNINAGTANIEIKALSKYYTGTHIISYTIRAINISLVEITCGEPNEDGCYDINNLSVIYDSKNLVLDSDYSISIQQGENEYYKFNTVCVTGINNYTGSVNKTFNYEKIEQEPEEPELIDINYLTILIEPSIVTYNGKEIVPTVTITDDDGNELIKDIDFIVEITDNISVGYGKCLITGIGEFTGTSNISFEITKLSISSADITCGEADENGCYNIDNLTVQINDLILSENDYDIEVETAENGDYIDSVLIITGKGNFKDSREVTYRTGMIKKVNISTLKFTLDQSIFEYNGNSHTPKLKVEDEDKVLVENEDYSVKYLNNTNVGIANIEIKALSKYYIGTHMVQFTILPINISEAIITSGASDENGCYNLVELKVTLNNIELNKNSDYRYSITTRRENYEIFSLVLITGIGNYTGEISKEFKTDIIMIDINEVDIRLEQYVFEFTGKIIEPKLLTSLRKGIDFEAIYENSIYKGEYDIKIIGLGNYTGTRIITYTIVPTTINDAEIVCGDPDENGCYDLNNIEVYVNDILLIKSKDYQIMSFEKEIEDGFIETQYTIYGIDNYIGSKTVTILTGKKQIYSGKSVKLELSNVYSRYCTNKVSHIKTGMFYLWDNKVVNNRIRVTNNPDGVGKLGYITGWVDLDNIILRTDIRIGDKVIVNGIINTYADGSGNNITRNNSIMYVVDMLDPNEFEYPYAVATDINRTKLGWASLDIIEMVKEDSL